MVCLQCDSEMVEVGHQIMPGHPEIWSDGWVCPKLLCPEYALSTSSGSISRWPGMTLMPDLPLHAMMRGAMKFRDRRPLL